HDRLGDDDEVPLDQVGRVAAGGVETAGEFAFRDLHPRGAMTEREQEAKADDAHVLITALRDDVAPLDDIVAGRQARGVSVPGDPGIKRAAERTEHEPVDAELVGSLLPSLRDVVAVTRRERYARAERRDADIVRAVSGHVIRRPDDCDRRRSALVDEERAGAAA